jgi:hypothetical protein
MATSLPLTLNFKRTLPFRSGAAGIEITGPKDARSALDEALLQAIVLDQAFPGTSDLSLANVAINMQAGKDLTFATGKGNVSFQAQAAASAGLNVYFDPTKMVRDLAVNEELKFTLASDPATYYTLLHWGFDAAASASGAVAMGTGALKFSAAATADKTFAVIRQFPIKTDTAGVGARTAILETVDSWILPSLVSDESNLPPASWIYSKVDGKFNGSVGVSYGYDFNWVREARFAGLKGDVGLKIQLGLSATLGFEISGKFAVVISREGNDPVLRVRIFRQPSKGFNFALNAGATVQPNTGTLLPESLDDFIRAILGTYAPQLIKDLQALEDWVSGKAPLSRALANLSAEYMLKLVGEIYKETTGKTFDPDNDFDQAKNLVLNFVNTWGGLDSKIASLLWKLVPEPGDEPAKAVFKQIAKITDTIAGGDQESFRDLLDATAGVGDFFSSPVGQWLEALAWGKVLEPATNSEAFETLQKIAKQLQPFLSGNQNTILSALHEIIEERFKLGVITEAVKKKLSEIDEEWVHAKIADFLEQKVFGFEDLKKLDQLIQTIRQRASELYAKGLKALNASYSFSLAATYQALEVDTALLDAEFDFSVPAASRAQLQQALQDAISGDLSKLLLQKIPGVKLNRAALSHSIERQSHIELRMPFYFSTIDHINKSLAAPNAVDVEDQRVVIYQLDASDEITKISNRGGNDSQLIMGAKIPAVAGNATRVFGEPTFTYSYSFRQASKDMRRDQLQYQFKPYVDRYVGKAFANNPFDLWLSEMDRMLHMSPTDRFGFALVSIDLSLPSQAVAAWLDAPAQEKSMPYMDMSIALQAALKTLIPFYYFSDVSKYNDIDPSYTLVAYSALPTTTSIRLSGNQLFLNTNQSVYWDWMDSNLRSAMIGCAPMDSKLRAMLPAIFQRIQASGSKKTASFFEPGDGTVRKIRDAVRNNDTLLRSLLFTEAEIVQGALKSGMQLARFRAQQGTDVKAASRALAAFGATITETFNKRVSSVYGGDAVRPLGTMLFLSAAQALSGRANQASALFRFLALKPDAQFQPADFLQGKFPDDGVLVQQSIVNA